MTKELSNRQLEIIEASGKILMTKGIKGLTTKNLAAEMNFSESALYRHFKSKEDIVVLLLSYLANNIEERITRFAATDTTAKEDLVALFKSQFHFFQHHPHFIVAILSEGLFDETEKIYEQMMKIVSLKTAILMKIIAKGQASNEFTTEIKTPDIVHILMGSFRLTMLKWKISKFQLNIEQAGNYIILQNIQLISKHEK
jgi:TetR/AcrR family transcriptional regulator, fatty acid metabolism regulator protein